MRWLSMVFVSSLVACSSGAKNGGAGGSGNAGGGGAGATAGGGSGGAGAAGGSGGGSSLSGSLSVPAGQTVDGVQVIACVPNAAGTDCDAVKSQAVTLSGSGTSATFDVAALAEPCYVIAVKDNNQSGNVDAGDLLGAALDADGSLLLVTPPVSNLTLSLAVVAPASGSIPAELVGKWQSISSDVGIDYTFNANGTWESMYVYDPTSCVVIDKVTSIEDGYANVQGTQLTFTPQSGSYQSIDCSGTVTNKPPSLTPRVYDYSISVDSSGVQQLTLVDPSNPGSPVTYTKQ